MTTLLTNLATRREGAEEFPAAIDRWTRVRWVLDAVHAVEHADSSHLGGVTPLPAGRLRSWLSVLCFSYSVGIYPSDEIERQ